MTTRNRTQAQARQSTANTVPGLHRWIQLELELDTPQTREG